jgi:hypothetical protein
MCIVRSAATRSTSSKITAAARPQALGLVGDAEGLALEALERALGEDDRLAGDGGRAMELHGGLLVLALVQRDDPPAIDVVLAHRGAQVGEQCRHGLAIGRRAFQAQAHAPEVALAARQQQRDRGLAAAREVDAGRDAGDHAPVADLDRHLLDRSGVYRPGHAPPGGDLGQGQRREARVGQPEADDLGLRQHRLERELEVRVIGGRQLGDGRRQAGGLGPEVLAQTIGQRRGRQRGGLDHAPHELLERRTERRWIR